MIVTIAAGVAAITTVATTYLAPRTTDWIEGQLERMDSVKRDRNLRSCRESDTFALAERPDTILRMVRRSTVITQDEMAIADFGTLVEVKNPGVLDLDLKLETKHRGAEYSEVIGVGSYVTVQYAGDRDGLAHARVVRPEGWSAGTNIRDLRDHYGQNTIVGALPVEPGFYRFCVFATAHSRLTNRTDLAEILVEQGSPLNTLRLSFKPGGWVLQ